MSNQKMITQGDIVNIWNHSQKPLMPPEPDPPPEEYIQWQIKIFNDVNRCSDIQQKEHMIIYHLINSIDGSANYSKAVRDLLKSYEEANGKYYGL